jgi:hypothetical protein
MKSLKKLAIYFAVYVLMRIGAVMAVQHSVWYMIPSILTISLGCGLMEYYAKNYDKFK